MADSQYNVAEKWRPISETNGRYEVSSRGRIRRSADQSILVGSFDRYHFVRYRVNGCSPKRYVHRVVACAFLEKPTKESCHVNHKNGDKHDNSVENLEWVTQRQNNRHAYRKKLLPSGGAHHWAKLTDEQVAFIRSQRGHRTQRSLAKEFGITQSAVSAIQLGKCHNSLERCA